MWMKGKGFWVESFEFLLRFRLGFICTLDLLGSFLGNFFVDLGE